MWQKKKKKKKKKGGKKKRQVPGCLANNTYIAPNP